MNAKLGLVERTAASRDDTLDGCEAPNNCIWLCKCKYKRRTSCKLAEVVIVVAADLALRCGPDRPGRRMQDEAKELEMETNPQGTRRGTGDREGLGLGSGLGMKKPLGEMRGRALSLL